MKKIGYLALAAAILVSFTVVDSFAFKLGGKDLVKKGTGRRTKFPIGTVYYASLYVPQEYKTKNAADIIKANVPMAVLLTVDTGLMTPARFKEATEKGFVKAEGSGYVAPAAKKAQFLGFFKPTLEMDKGDKIYIQYIPGRGTQVSLQFKKTGKFFSMGTVASLEFKKSLFAIWLGPNPVQASCKKGMMGQ